nr:MAG TPA: ECF sigma factor [Caudoviricetes sp.]
MDSQHKAIRAQLTSMAPKRAVAYILSFELPNDEAACIIECDVKRKSCVQVAGMLHTSPDTVKRYRQRAYRKIAYDISGTRDAL